MKQLIAFALLFGCTVLRANDSLVISRLLQRIDQLQVKVNGVFPKGSIPSYRQYAFNKTWYKADSNPFYAGLVAFTLRDLMPDLSPAQQVQAHAIIDNAAVIYPKFRNRKDGRDTYNFWPTDTPQIFPHAGWINLFDKSRALPDDMDDTVILLLAQRVKDSIAKTVHALMQNYTYRGQKNVHNTFPEMNVHDVYSTWFGKKMPVEFDVCVLSNVLSFVQLYHLDWTKSDSASLRLIENTIASRKYERSPDNAAPQYARQPIILYHISRLMSVRPIPSLEKLKPQLIEDARKALASAHSFMDEVILSTALLRWGAVPAEMRPHKANSLQDLVEDEQFVFFIANMATILPNWLKRWVAAVGIDRFNYYSPAYNNVLLIENLVWRKRRGLE